MKNVAIIGQGEIGSAIAHVLKNKRNMTLRTWDADPEKPRNATTCETAVIGADIIIVAIPTRALPICFSTLQKIAPKNAFIVSVAKGMIGEPPKFVAEILSEHFAPGRIGLLSGAMLAEELFSGKVGEAVIAGSNEVCAEVTNIFNGTMLHVSCTHDIIGTSVSGVLKNIYATGMGMVEGLELGANARGMFIEHTINEMQGIAEELGGQKSTVFGPAGIGDLIATATSKHSTNYAYGKERIRGRNAQKGEGARAAELLVARIDIKKYKVLEHIIMILLEKRPGKSLRTFYE